MYVDLFLLWILYKFMKPQRELKDGRTEASVLLFAHDAAAAERSLLDSFIQEYGERKAKILM